MALARRGRKRLQEIQCGPLSRQDVASRATDYRKHLLLLEHAAFSGFPAYLQ